MIYILDNLAIGNIHDALEPPPEISALLCVADDQEIIDAARVYYKIPVVDMTSITAPQLHEAVEWIRANIATHRIMVFCRGGVGRSPSVVVGYLCCALGYGFGEAVEFVATKKPRISLLPHLITRIAEVKGQFPATPPATTTR